MVETQTCGLCGAEASLKYSSYPGYQEPDTFDIYHCKNCEASFPFPVREDVDKIYDLIYENKSKISGYKRYFGFSQQVKLEKDPFKYLAYKESPYFGVWKILHEIPEPQNVKVLEVGSGLGYLTYSLKKAGFDVVGIDISQKVVSQATKEFGALYKQLDIFEYAKDTSDTYDYIVLTEVIEHVPKPVEFIRTLLSLLNSNGKLIVTTPNKGVFDSRTVWGSDLPPVHLWWLTEKSMKVIADLTRSKVSFLTFEDYYKHKPAIIDVSVPDTPVLPASVFNKEGVVNSLGGQSGIYEKFKSWVFSKRVLMNIYANYMVSKNPDIRKLTSKGVTICAIYEK